MTQFKIDVYTHGFTVKLLYTNDKTHLLSFSSDLAEFEWVYAPRVKRKVKKVKAVFAIASRDRMQYGFLKGDLQPLLEHLARARVGEREIEITYHEAPPGEPIDIRLSKGVTLRDEEQESVMRFITEEGKHNRVLNLRTGGGKAMPLDSKIKAPNGWRTMGDMEVGTIITAWDGTPTKVTGVYPQGVEAVYTLTFEDGRTVDASGGHLWKIHNSRYRLKNKSQRWSVITTHELIRLLKIYGGRLVGKLSVPLIVPDEGITVDLPIPPYLLGLILGRSIINDMEPILHIPDPLIAEEMNDNLRAVNVGLRETTTKGYYDLREVDRNGSRSLRVIYKLHRLGLNEHGGRSRFIPDCYLNASLEQRLALLNGLMDADGYIEKNYTLVYRSQDAELTGGIQTLIRSVGGIARLTRRIGGWHTHRLVDDKLIIHHPTPTRLFGMPSRKCKLCDNNRWVNNLKLRVTRVEFKGMEETQCISIDHPDCLYVADNYVVTHNTLLGLYSITHFKVRTGLVMEANHIKTWIDSMGWVYDKEKQFCVIRGRDSLKRIIELSLSGENDYKLIFFSIATLRAYVKDYMDTGDTIEGVHPRDLFRVLGIGYRIIDEAHQSIHAIAVQNIFTHVKQSLYLSATLVTEDPFLKKQYNKLFPNADFYKGGRNNTHVRAISVTYHIRNYRDIRCIGSMGYNHVKYEQWLMGNKSGNTLSKYTEMIESILEEFYHKDRQEGQKALVFCSTTELCELVEAELKEGYGALGLTISSYYAKHDPEVLYSNDVIISTPTSAGTGKDIPNLRFAMSTCAVGSVKLNLQMMGRLRPLIDYPDVTPIYVWLTCLDIPKHIEYDNRKREQYVGRCKSIETLPYATIL